MYWFCGSSRPKFFILFCLISTRLFGEIIKETTKDFGYLQILDFYTEEELDWIWKEISYLDYIIELLEESIYLDDDKLVEKVLAILQHIQSENNFEQYKDDDDWWMGLGDDE